MNYSAEGLKLTERFEGCKLEAYLDSVGVPTIGYGHTRGVKMGTTCTQEQAEKWLSEDIQAAVDGVNKLVKVAITQGQFDALVDFAFNLGVGALGKSTLLRLTNAGDFKAASPEFLRWNKAGGKELAGLTKRREAERRLFDGI